MLPDVAGYCRGKRDREILYLKSIVQVYWTNLAYSGVSGGERPHICSCLYKLSDNTTLVLMRATLWYLDMVSLGLDCLGLFPHEYDGVFWCKHGL